MRIRRNRLLAAPLLALVGVLAFAGPAHAAGATVGDCMAEKIEHLIEEAHGDLDDMKHELHDKLHDKKVQEKIEGCFEAPNPIIPEVNEIIWGGAAFLILFVLMVKKGFPAVKGAMDARAEKIRGDLDAAEKAKTDAQAVQSDYESRLADAKGEASRLVDEARVAADQIRSDLVARAEADAAGIRERAAAEADAAKAQAIADLRAEVSGIALGAAERVVQSSLDAEVQGRLIDAYIDEVAGSNG
ncbi:MAG TPA: ATP synthase F0 subunit B [Acidimicrobiaceae bacterium]|nr:ATP synthase F0 subunit B [Acidimicrobiaceae bacterium]HCV33281.1 ATP synthase F0 subunit B [Acidimicrobiaceae bacterium]|tara:strand:- start:2559 stop:3290 length:732 start_codon:yes stop_codon:yes gene_type:complete